jgi:hypothetical protein
MKTYGGVEVDYSCSLFSFMSQPLYPRGRAGCTNWRDAGWCGSGGDVRNLSLLPDIEPRFLGSTGYSLVSIPAELSCTICKYWKQKYAPEIDSQAPVCVRVKSCNKCCAYSERPTPSYRRRGGPTSKHTSNLGTKKKMVVSSDGARNQE